MRRLRSWCGLLCASLCFMPAAFAADARIRVSAQDSGTTVRLRGISAVDTDIAWASGRDGTVLRTVDGGAHWQTRRVAGAETLDFRDIEGFDADTALALSIGPGESSRVYRTTDGGEHWLLVLQNRDARAFFDCMEFDGRRGWLLGDPVDGAFQLYLTLDKGRTWYLQPDGPKAEAGEAAFAASGTCLLRTRDGLAMAGGGSVSRVQLRRDDDHAWRAHDSGMGRKKPEAGVFSLAATPFGAFLVGGDYKAEQAPGNAAEWRPDGKGASPRTVTAPRGYRSGAACVGTLPLRCVAVGPGGADAWDGKAWTPLSDTGYDAVDLAGTVGWASGDGGRIAKIEIDR
jgi:photosystem II stability/assembly factor-like uncharacterized protein